MKTVFITGSSGFIGYSLSLHLLTKGFTVIGLDNHNNYYDKNLKVLRNKQLKKFKNFMFIHNDLSNTNYIFKKVTKIKIEFLIHLAARPGVSGSISDPHSYLTNITDNFYIYDLVKRLNVKKLIYASSSSIYSISNKKSFSENDKITNFNNFYGLTKYTNEIFDNYFSSLLNIKSVGLRFFSVYGPFGRPDMAYYSFVDSILKNKTINVFNYGKNKRDFTYIDDVIDGIYSLIIRFDKINNLKPTYNIGNQSPRSISDMIKIIEKTLNVKAKISFKKKSYGDAEYTAANTKLANKDFNFKSKTSLEEGMKKFIGWYLKNKV